MVISISRANQTRIAYFLASGLILSFAKGIEASHPAGSIYFDSSAHHALHSARSAEKEKLIKKLAAVKSTKDKAHFDAINLLWNIIQLYCGFIILREKIQGDTSTWQNLLTNAGCGIIGINAMINGGTYLANVCQAYLGHASKQNFISAEQAARPYQIKKNKVY